MPNTDSDEEKLLQELKKSEESNNINEDKSIEQEQDMQDQIERDAKMATEYDEVDIE